MNDLKIGTKINPPIPRINMILLLNNFLSEASSFFSEKDKSPLIEGRKDENSKGTAKEMMEGKNIAVIKGKELTFFPIQSMVVVTSPIGVQAPPAFAAMIIIDI